MYKILLVCILIICLTISNIAYGFTFTSHLADKNSRNVDNFTDEVLIELKECKDAYHTKMQSFFDQYNIDLPTDEEKRTCDFKSIGAYVDITNEFILALQGNKKIDEYVDYIKKSLGDNGNVSEENDDSDTSCKRFIEEEYIKRECIESRDDFIPLRKYHALLISYKYCAFRYFLNLTKNRALQSGSRISEKDILISDALSAENKIAKWIDDEIEYSSLALPLAVSIYREEKKAAQIIQPICKLINYLDVIRLITLDLRTIVTRWVPIIPKRQLMDGQ